MKYLKHSVGQNAYHLVWKTKYAIDLFKSIYYCKACEGALRLVAIRHKFKIYELQVMPEHIHLFVECQKQFLFPKHYSFLKVFLFVCYEEISAFFVVISTFGALENFIVQLAMPLQMLSKITLPIVMALGICPIISFLLIIQRKLTAFA